MPEIEDDLGINHRSAGSLFLMISSGYFMALIGSGWIAAGLNHRKTIILSTGALGMTLAISAFCGSLGSIRLALFAVGLTAGLYLPSSIATLTDLIEPRQWGRAIAIHEMAPNLAFVIAPLLCELLLFYFSWREVVLMLGVITMVMSIVYARFGRGGRFYGTAPGLDAIKIFITEPAFWIMALLFGLGISSSLGVYTMLPLYLVADHGIERNLANSVIAVSRVSGLFMALAGGWVADRFGSRITMTAVFFFTGMITIILGIGSGPLVMAALFLQPMAAVCFFPAGFAALARIGPPGARNIAVSLAVPFGFVLGGGAVPWLIGFMGDTVSFAAGILIVGGCITAGAIPAYLLKLRNND
jgi:NNP family nitrate/nitrite transporter-like MFS transporter